MGLSKKRIAENILKAYSKNLHLLLFLGYHLILGIQAGTRLEYFSYLSAKDLSQTHAILGRNYSSCVHWGTCIRVCVVLSFSPLRDVLGRSLQTHYRNTCKLFRALFSPLLTAYRWSFCPFVPSLLALLIEVLSTPGISSRGSAWILASS